jgi:hypothetical protein
MWNDFPKLLKKIYTCLMDQHYGQGRTQGGEGGGLQRGSPPNLKFNKHRFCRGYDIKKFYVISPSSKISH